MYLTSLFGHATSRAPDSSGAPTECSAGTKSRAVPASATNRASTFVPMRVMIFMEATTYAESVISTPSIGFSADSGPMQNGITYIVRPRIEPRYSSVMVSFISAGSIQLLVGPASAGSAEQMNVRCSTRATSSGSEAAQNEFGFFFNRVKVPVSTSWSVNRVHSSSEPVTQTTSSGVVSSATSRTQERSRSCVVGALSTPGMATAVISLHLLTGTPSNDSGRRCPNTGRR